MTPRQITLVQDSFTQVAPVADQAAVWFYERLFEQNPELRPLFRGDIRKQGAMLMQTLALAVKHLHEPEAILETVRALGRRHVGYGVRAAHYAPVGAALLWTLERGLGETFTEEVQAAWAAAYTMLADIMLAGAAEIDSEAA